MDRWVLFAALVGSAVLVSFGAIFLLHDYLTPAFANGAFAAERIDDIFGDAIAAQFPAATVGAARCPVIINLTGGRTGTCTLPIGDAELRITVGQGDGGIPALDPVDALFVTPDAQRALASMLAERYGEPFDVQCPGPATRAVAPDAGVTCTIDAPDMLRRGIQVAVRGYRGDVMPERLKAVSTRAERLFGRDIATRTEGSVTVPGPAMERYVQGTTSADAHGEVGRRGLVGRALCPRQIALREGDMTTCTVLVGGLPFTYGVHFGKGVGLVVESGKHIEVLAQLREIATRYFERSQFTGGKPLQAHVDCGNAQIAVVEPGSSIPCTANIADDHYNFNFNVDGEDGQFTILRSDMP